MVNEKVHHKIIERQAIIMRVIRLLELAKIVDFKSIIWYMYYILGSHAKREKNT